MPASPEPFDLEISSGTLRAHRTGSGGDLVICVPGLSANSRSFDFVASEIAATGRTVVAVDLRGRGWSEITGMGTYGWKNHARDVLEIATRLGAERFDYVGHSMGAFIGLELARTAPKRVGKMVLIDAAGIPETASLVPILAAVGRLGTGHKDADTYIELLRGLGTIPWSAMWETHYRYDLVETERGVRPRTDHAAVLEDMAYGATQNPRAFWSDVSMPSLLVRANKPLGGGFIVSRDDADAFVTRAPRAKRFESESNHYGVMTDPAAAASIRSFLS